MKREKTPQWVDEVLEFFAPDRFEEEIKGDLHEIFQHDVKRHGIQKARAFYVSNAIGFFFKNFFWKNYLSTANPPLPMLLNHFRMAQRSLRFHKSSSFINMLGLVVGLASALIILAVIRYESSFDTFHSNSERIYRVVRVSGAAPLNMDEAEFRTGISYPVPDALKTEISSIEEITTVRYMGDATVDIPQQAGVREAKFLEDRGTVMVEPSFFKIFDFRDARVKWFSGNPETALEEPFSVVLTKSIADKYFPDVDPIGMSILFEKRFECKVTGVVSDLPPNTDFPFTVLISYSTLSTFRADLFDEWFSVDDNNQSFILLPDAMLPAEMEGHISKVHAAHTPEDLHKFRHYLLQPLDELHYDTRFGTFNGRTISKNTVMGLSLIGIFLLLVAAINYINLSTAQSVVRSKEIGIRKVLGSKRSNLVFQFLLETGIVVVAAATLAVVLVEVALPHLQALLNVTTTGLVFADPFMIGALAGIVLVVTLFSGLYPAIVISRFNPARSLKNRFSTESLGSVSLRKVLVVVQFSLTQILVVGTFIVVSQMKFFQEMDMGFNKEAIITLPMHDRDPGKRQVMQDLLTSESFVRSMSFSSTLPSGRYRNRNYWDIGPLSANSHTDYTVFEYEAIDSSYLKVFGIPLLAGRNLRPGDSVGNILLNRTLMSALMLGSPMEALGRELKINGKKVTVVGVVEDFYSNSVKESVDKIAMLSNPDAYSNVSVKLDLQTAGEPLNVYIARLEDIWTKIYPDHIFEYRFLDENIKSFYDQENKYAQLFQLFSIVFLVIGCLGLYGLVSFVVNRKGKEVAVRKVLGASWSNIIGMFSTEYVRLILISFVIAVPVAYYAVDSWLSTFADHIPLTPWLFMMPGTVVLVIAMLVITSKSLAAANANPVDKLKYE